MAGVKRFTNLRCVNGRREEVDKLVAEAAASVSALETQIHRQVLTARRQNFAVFMDESVSVVEDHRLDILEL